MTQFRLYVRLTFAVLCSVVHSTQAGTLGRVSPASLLPHDWFVTVEGGAAWPYIHKDLFVANGAPIASGLGYDHFTGNSPDNGMVSVQGGYQWIWGCAWFPGISLALRYQHFFTNSVQGYIDQYGLILFRNYQYSFDISADLISIYSKLDIFYVDKFFFFVDAGLGAASTRAGNFSEVPLTNVTPRVSPAWQNRNQTNFSYTVGAGMDFFLTPKITLTAGYDFQNLGRMHLGNGVGTWSGTELGIHNYKANVIYGGVTYFFDRVVCEK